MNAKLVATATIVVGADAAAAAAPNEIYKFIYALCNWHTDTHLVDYRISNLVFFSAAFMLCFINFVIYIRFVREISWSFLCLSFLFPIRIVSKTQKLKRNDTNTHTHNNKSKEF